MGVQLYVATANHKHMFKIKFVINYYTLCYYFIKGVTLSFISYGPYNIIYTSIYIYIVMWPDSMIWCLPRQTEQL